jgi:hypothetical protein
VTSIYASLTISFSTAGFTALQPTSPTQRFTPATGQRAYTIQDALGALNDQLNGATDPTSNGPDTPDVLYTFTTSSDGMIVLDNMTAFGDNDLSVWDGSSTYVESAWQ